MMPAVESTRGKRIVFLRPDGLPQIMGHQGDLAALPVTAQNFVSLGQTIPFASLVKVTSRAAYYKTPMEPTSYDSMHEAQR